MSSLDEKALETRRERLVAQFQARMGRWQPVQAAAFAVVTIGLVAWLGDQVSLPMLLLALVSASMATAVSAGVQAGYEVVFKRQMDDLERAFERVKRGRSNL